MIHRARVSRTTWYWQGGSLHLFRFGVHVKRRRSDGMWRQYRLAICSTKPGRSGVRLIDYSARTTRRAITKPIAPCWRFWIGVKAGQSWSEKHYGPRP